jgi:predicted branched-subunit amino acid permease
VKSSFYPALKNAYPIMLGYFVVSAIFGIGEVELNLPLWFIALSSLLVYAGTAQFLFLVLFALEASIFSIVLTTFLVNLRHLLMSMYMANLFDSKDLGRTFRLFYAYEITDEAFAFQSKNHNFPQQYFVIFNFLCHSSWVLGSIFGALMVGVLGDVKSLNLAYGITAMMIYVLVLLIDSKLKLFIAVIAVAIMLILNAINNSYFNIFIATFIASLLGVIIHKQMVKTNDK